jgi:uncharacterized protein DUF6029
MGSTWRLPPIMVACALLAASCLAASGPARAQVRLPYGFSAAWQSEYSYGKNQFSELSGDDRLRVFENWTELGFAQRDFSAGLRFVAFQPPDPSIYKGPSSHGVDFIHAEYAGRPVAARAGHFYAMFGRGLALRLYEDRTLRVDHNALGGLATLHLPDGALTALGGATVAGNAEDANRKRSEPLYGADLEHGLWEPAKLRLGGSFATTELTTGDRGMEPLWMKAGRASGAVRGVDLFTEFAHVNGPNPRTRSDFHGHGLYGSASTSFQGLALVLEYKDYDSLLFENDAGKSMILPPAVLRNHTFNLLNRHPHQLETADERGVQVEATYVTKRFIPEAQTSLLFNWGMTRNHSPAAMGNYFDDTYFEAQQEFGEALMVTGGVSYQRSFLSAQTSDPFRTLWTPVADLRLRLNEIHSLHLQLEHQHDTSDFFGQFDIDFAVLEWSRSPNLTLGVLLEHTNKSDTQLELLDEKGRNFVAGTLDYTLFDQHELRFYYGTRNAGFICVGGVCRLEPAFDGFEVSLVSRF